MFRNINILLYAVITCLLLLTISTLHGAPHIGPDKEGMANYYARLSKYWASEDIQLFFTRFIDYTFPKATEIDRKDLMTAHDEWSRFSISASFGIGRLGNQMCNVASQFALYQDFGIVSFISNYSYTVLSNTFLFEQSPATGDKTFYKRITPKNIDRNKLSWIYISNEDMIYRRSYIFKRYRYSWFFKLEPNVCDFKSFFSYIKQLRNGLFKFNQNVLGQANIALRNILQDSKNHITDNIYVAIHIRSTDMEEDVKIKYNISLPSKTYFTRAMTLLQQRFTRRVIFVAFSDNNERARELLDTKQNKKLTILYPSVDDTSSGTRVTLALLSLAQGSILTYGTFGIWGALLRTQQTNIVAPVELLKTGIGFYLSTANISGIYYI